MSEQKSVAIKKQVVKDIFTRIFDVSHSVESVFLSSTDGHPLANHSKKPLSEPTLAAMTSSCMALGDRISTEVNHNGCDFVIIQNQEGYMALKRVGKKLVITVVTNKDVNLGLLLSVVKNAALNLEREINNY